MTSSYRRYEILLPLRFNDGQAVPDELIADTKGHLRTIAIAHLGYALQPHNK
jgi:hypothetical protein